ncbi:MAG TPA: hypothetical protein PLF30_03095 [Candidatus Moranbacteria bacterium]|jgi:hypothetical protein|nr:hypothetical protein [Candidatus Moranbacteria bacterium]HQB59960.1 hypothetical protein [Candidatus Moranbacteria bacterium]
MADFALLNQKFITAEKQPCQKRTSELPDLVTIFKKYGAKKVAGEIYPA